MSLKIKIAVYIELHTNTTTCCQHWTRAETEQRATLCITKATQQKPCMLLHNAKLTKAVPWPFTAEQPMSRSTAHSPHLADATSLLASLKLLSSLQAEAPSTMEISILVWVQWPTYMAGPWPSTGPVTWQAKLWLNWSAAVQFLQWLGYGLDDLGFDSWEGQAILPISKVPRLTLGSTQQGPYIPSTYLMLHVVSCT
jgi:hypothetical protein